MNHVTDRLQRYLDGEAPPAEARDVAAHLRQCPACRGEYAALASLWQVVDTAQPVLPAVSVYPALATRRTWRRERIGSAWMRSGLATAALIAGLVLGLSLARPAATRLAAASAADDETEYLQSLTTLDQLWWSAGTQDEAEVGS